MTRLIPQRDMPAADLLRCASEAIAIMNLCHHAAWRIQNEADAVAKHMAADDIMQATRLAAELLEPVTEALEAHEGVKREWASS